MIVAVAVATLPLAMPQDAHAQGAGLEGRPVEPLVKTPAPILKYSTRFSKMPARGAIVGIDNGMPIYENGRGEHFYLDPATGDMVFLAADAFERFRELTRPVRPGTALKLAKWSAVKFGGEVTILGVDAAGHTLHQNARGDMFFLDPATGDMMFVR